MKKIYLTLGLGALFLGANAQQLNIAKQPDFGKVHVTNKLGNPASTYSVTIDTLMPASIMAGGCAVGSNTAISGFYISPVNNKPPTPNDSGYVFGTQLPGSLFGGNLTVTQLAQRYNVGSSAAHVTNVLVWAGVAAGSVTTTTASILSEVTGNGPGAIIGSPSTPVPMSAYVTALTSASGFTSFTFPTPVPVAANTNFFAAISIPAFGGTDKDTLAVINTAIGCSSVDSLLWLYVAGTGGNQWASLLQATGGSANCDVMIFPVIDITTGINNYVSHGDLSVFAASPNPANNTININFSLNNPSKVEIEVYDISGKIVKSVKNNESFASGKNSIGVDLTSLEAGTYMYSINANGNRMFSKFVVTK
jgi:hypothetical protein